MEPELVAAVRRFNRVVTQRIGALNDRYLATDRPLGAARMLWEIGPDGRDVRSLRVDLGLDSGYASRLLRSLEAAGLIATAASPADRRIRTARLTGEGRSERALLDQRSDELATSLLAPLNDRQRERLVTAMRDVERLLTAGLVEVRLVDPTHPDVQGCLNAYFAELRERSARPFDPHDGSTAEPHEVRPPAGAMLVAYLNGKAIGCGAVKHRAGGPSDVKRMWVSPSARGLGVGRRLLAALEAEAARSGAPATRLETNDALAEAIALYRSAGYEEVPQFNSEPYADRWFAKPLNG